VSTSPTEAARDAYEQTHGYRQEVKCSTCGEVWTVRFLEGEAVHDDSLNCHCGGRGEVV
jgi:hypothetical protein